MVISKDKTKFYGGLEPTISLGDHRMNMDELYKS
jgi:hypothetical protein